MHPFYREIELIKPVSDYFTKSGYTVMREVRIGYCRADVVAFKDDMVTAVELKLSDRKKAVVQAKNYQLGADYVYLAFPLKKSSLLLEKSGGLLEEEGIGLLVIDETTCEVHTVIEAKQSKRKFASVTLESIHRHRNKRKSKYRC